MKYEAQGWNQGISMQAGYTWEGWFSAPVASSAFILLPAIRNRAVGVHQIAISSSSRSWGAAGAAAYKCRGARGPYLQSFGGCPE